MGLVQETEVPAGMSGRMNDANRELPRAFQHEPLPVDQFAVDVDAHFRQPRCRGAMGADGDTQTAAQLLDPPDMIGMVMRQPDGRDAATRSLAQSLESLRQAVDLGLDR